jgi:hypothetical protein
MITLNPNAIANVDRAPAEVCPHFPTPYAQVIAAERKLEEAANAARNPVPTFFC